MECDRLGEKKDLVPGTDATTRRGNARWSSGQWHGCEENRENSNRAKKKERKEDREMKKKLILGCVQ